MTHVGAKSKKIAGKFKLSPTPVLKLNGNYISDPKLVSDVFAGHFAKVSSKDKNKPFYRQRMREELPITELNHTICLLTRENFYMLWLRVEILPHD